MCHAEDATTKTTWLPSGLRAQVSALGGEPPKGATSYIVECSVTATFPRRLGCHLTCFGSRVCVGVFVWLCVCEWAFLHVNVNGVSVPVCVY